MKESGDIQAYALTEDAVKEEKVELSILPPSRATVRVPRGDRLQVNNSFNYVQNKEKW